MFTTVEQLCRGCPIEFHQYMHYSKNLKFEEAPDYKYMMKLFTSLAEKENIDLHDNMYDWNVRAVTLKNHSNFYDFIKNQDSHPFNARGKFHFKISENLGVHDQL